MNIRHSLARLFVVSAVLSSSLLLSAQARWSRAVPDEASAYVVTETNGEAACRDATPAEAAVINARHGVAMKVFGEEKGRIRTNGEAGLNIILRGTAQLDANPEAKEAFERAAAIWESKITSPVTVIVDVDFGPQRFGTAFPENVIASANTDSYRYSDGDYDELQDGLVARADNATELAIYNALPQDEVPTNVGLLEAEEPLNNFISTSILLRALGVDPSFPPVATTGDPRFPNIGFNSAFLYDFDPTNGIQAQRKDFEGVVVHEIGHMLGFTSRAGATEIAGVVAGPTVLDLFRFRPGVNLGTFTTAPRILTTTGDQIFFAGGPELALSTGNPNGENGDGNQASHWKDDALSGTRIGIMDPTLGNARRSELTDNDLAAFAIIGWRMSTDLTEPEPEVPAAPAGLSATLLTTTSARLNWTDASSNETSFILERKTLGGTFAQFATAAANATTADATSLNPGTQYTFRVKATNAVGDSSYSNEVTVTTGLSPAPCVASSTVVCLLSNRFRVTIDYVNPFSNPPNQPGTFLTARLLSGVQNPDTALFGFASAQAVEVVVRIQDTRPFAPRFDVYFGGMTDVGYIVTVTDTQSGVTRQYRNAVGNVGGGADRNSFPAN